VGCGGELEEFERDRVRLGEDAAERASMVGEQEKNMIVT